MRILWGAGPDRWAALYPEEHAPAWSVESPSWLEREVVLDGAQETERLGVVACDGPLSHQDAVEALTRGARGRCELQTIEVEKR